MSTPYLGDIEVFGFNFAPVGWMQCNGQLLPISENQALFALLGTTYGGNGVSTFGLPDYRGRAAVHYGQAPGLSAYVMGEMTGTETVTLLTTQMPAHNHTALSVSTGGTTNVPTGNLWAKEGGGNQIYAPAPADTAMGAQSIGADGGNQPHENIPPTLTMNYCICVEGAFPQQS